jgi:hypothetical protein
MDELITSDDIKSMISLYSEKSYNDFSEEELQKIEDLMIKNLEGAENE